MPTTTYSEEEYENLRDKYTTVNSVLNLIYRSFNIEHSNRLRKLNDEVHYPFVPKSNYEVIDHFFFLKKYFEKQDIKCFGSKFLDVGCGVGNILLLAHEILEMRVQGIERDEKLSLMAHQFLNGNESIFNMDAFNFKLYQDYDVIYYYCPIEKKSLQIKLESLIEKSMKKGAYLMPFLKQNQIEDDYKTILKFNGKFEEIDENYTIFRKVA